MPKKDEPASKVPPTPPKMDPARSTGSGILVGAARTKQWIAVPNLTFSQQYCKCDASWPVAHTVRSNFKHAFSFWCAFFLTRLLQVKAGLRIPEGFSSPMPFKSLAF